MDLGIYFANLMCSFLPVREILGVRRCMYRMGGLKVGRGVRFTHGVAVYGRHIEIGDRVWVGMKTLIASTVGGTVTIGSDVDIAPRCCIVAGTHEIGGPERRAGREYGQDIRIGSGCWIGAQSTILGGADIDPGCIIAAGSVVRPGKYKSNSLIAGVPATIKRTIVGRGA